MRLVYNHFTSPIEQTLMDDVILPVPKEAVTDGDDERPPVSYIYEPAPGGHPRGPAARLRRDRRVPGAPRVERQRAGRPHVGDAQRQRRAEEMIDGLTLALNRARQAAITQEILEVVGGAEALG